MSTSRSLGVTRAAANTEGGEQQPVAATMPIRPQVSCCEIHVNQLQVKSSPKRQAPRSTPSPGLVTCQMCGDQLSSAASLYNHMRGVHKKLTAKQRAEVERQNALYSSEMVSTSLFIWSSLCRSRRPIR